MYAIVASRAHKQDIEHDVMERRLRWDWFPPRLNRIANPPGIRQFQVVFNVEPSCYRPHCSQCRTRRCSIHEANLRDTEWLLGQEEGTALPRRDLA